MKKKFFIKYFYLSDIYFDNFNKLIYIEVKNNSKIKIKL